MWHDMQMGLDLFEKLALLHFGDYQLACILASLVS